MSLFQNSVVNKQLASQDKSKLNVQWIAFKNHFHNKLIQDNIRSSKEEQYQGEFLIDLFVNVLGYVKNPTPSFTLTTEYKNIKDSKKADGAILVNDKVKAVIELKGTNTTDLGKIEVQAFGYKNNQPDCVYVITSNFEKLRFYIDNATEFLEFNLFQLTEKEFGLLYLCLAYNNIANDVPKKLKEQSATEEKNITKDLYSDYSLFKRELHQNLVALNPSYDALVLFQKSQKLLDRFLFIFFAEDRNLLPTNLIFRINKEWRQLQEMRMRISLYDRYKTYFHDLNQGAKVILPIFSQTTAHEKEEHQIFAYNGGLFQPDDVLNSVNIDDELLYKHTIKLSKYDFVSEIDVNILGHIFENSLNELDEIKAQLDGVVVEKATTKRKKDGVFYTPKYITKYIVDKTVGKLCLDKKVELNINEEDYIFIKTIRTKLKRGEKAFPNEKKESLSDKLKTYRHWLLQITICDPACGSGAFLNQALDFLIQEHRYIDELQAKLFGDALVLSDVEKSILENNLFGVDINEESVEIAKLSLWLRTARPHRKLNDLNHNIKCGNSLINDVLIAGEKAFNWQTAFPQVFINGGFDVIIGNPPYVKEATNRRAFNGLHSHPCYQGKMDLWYFFGWMGLEIAKINTGIIGYIAPNNWITNDGAFNFRNKIIKDSVILEFIDFGDFKVFESAGIQTMIYIMTRNSDNLEYVFEYSKLSNKKVDANEIQDFLLKISSEKSAFYKAKIIKEQALNSIITFSNETNNILLKKIENKANFYLNKNEINSGIDIGQDFVNSKSKAILGEGFEVNDGVFNLSQKEYDNYNFSDSEKSLLKPFYTTKEINRYLKIMDNNYWVIYTSSKFKNHTEILPFPNLKRHLDKFQSIITSDNKPYGIHRTRNENIFKGEKIFSIRKCINPSFCYVDFDAYVNRTYNIIKSERINLKYLTSLLNSNLIKFWLKEKGKLQGEIFQIDINPIVSIPLVQINESERRPFIENSDLLYTLNSESLSQCQKFQRAIQRKFDLEVLPKKLQDWYLLSYADFIKELAKQKVKLSLSQEAEWEDYFTTEANKLLAIKAEINQTDKEIDNMIYKLYDLTAEEILIVENS